MQPFRDFLRTLAPTYEYETLPCSYFAAAYTLVVNPLVSVVAETRGCSDNLCMSYILSGGLEMVIPWVPQGYDDHSMVMVKNVPSIQADFTGPTMDRFNDSDCDVFGQSRVAIGIQLCLALNFAWHKHHQIQGRFEQVCVIGQSGKFLLIRDVQECSPANVSLITGHVTETTQHPILRPKFHSALFERPLLQPDKITV